MTDNAQAQSLSSLYVALCQAGVPDEKALAIVVRSPVTENTESLVLEHLRHIRGRVDQISEGMNDLKARMSSLEAAMTAVKRDIVHHDDVDARQQISLDRIIDRIERIERRLDLSEAP